MIINNEMHPIIAELARRLFMLKKKRRINNTKETHQELTELRNKIKQLAREKRWSQEEDLDLFCLSVTATEETLIKWTDH